LALTDERRLMRTAKSCGPGAPMQALSRSDASSIAPATVANKLVHRGEREVSRKPSRREGRSVSACTCGQRAPRAIFCAWAVGAAGTRSSLRPLFFERVIVAKARANSVARSCACAMSVSRCLALKSTPRAASDGAHEFQHRAPGERHGRADLPAGRDARA